MLLYAWEAKSSPGFEFTQAHWFPSCFFISFNLKQIFHDFSRATMQHIKMSTEHDQHFLSCGWRKCLESERSEASNCFLSDDEIIIQIFLPSVSDLCFKWKKKSRKMFNTCNNTNLELLIKDIRFLFMWISGIIFFEEVLCYFLSFLIISLR